MSTTCRYRCKNGKIFLEATKTFVNCPDCRNIIKQIEAKDESGKSIADYLLIPYNYRNIQLKDLDELFEVARTQRFRKESIQKVIEVLEEIERSIYNEEPLRKSYYIFTSSSVDIKKFVYKIQLEAKVEKGLSVSPFISLNELNGLIRLSDCSKKDLEQLAQGFKKDVNPDMLDAIDGVKIAEEINQTYMDFIKADICFLEATADTKIRGWHALQDILAMRSRRNKATVVFGFWSSIDKQNTGILRFIKETPNKLSGLEAVDISEGKGSYGSYNSSNNIATAMEVLENFKGGKGFE